MDGNFYVQHTIKSFWVFFFNTIVLFLLLVNLQKQEMRALL